MQRGNDRHFAQVLLPFEDKLKDDHACRFHVVSAFFLVKHGPENRKVKGEQANEDRGVALEKNGMRSRQLHDIHFASKLTKGQMMGRLLPGRDVLKGGKLPPLITIDQR
jgi:hypothetical protein